MPRPYLLSVASNPTKLSPELWIKWYQKGHLKDMVSSKAATNGAFYKSNSVLFTSNSPPPDGSEAMDFLALYQTGRPDIISSEEIRTIPQKSQMWLEEVDESLSTIDVANFVIGEGVLVEILGSYEHTEAVAPFIIHVRLSGEEVEGKLQFEHVNAVSILDGYRRTLLYRFPKLNVFQEGSNDAPSVILVHEFDKPPDSGFFTEVKREMEKIEPTKDCSFQLRSFELLHDEGFEGRL